MSAATPLAQAAWLAAPRAACWFAVWLSIGRREQFVVPFLDGLVLGLGIPIMGADMGSTALPLPVQCRLLGTEPDP
jgi:hypothetical protein